MTSKRKRTCLALLVFNLWGCQTANPPDMAFYFWRTHCALGAQDAALLAGFEVQRLYLRMFDVVWQEGQGAVPNAAVKLAPGTFLPDQVVPVVFIERSVLSHLGSQGTSDLAAHLVSGVARLFSQSGLGPPDEFQIDCDWEPAERERYFDLIAKVRAQLQKLGWQVRLSGTIRLYQLRHRERAGIPPFDEGILMLYHTGAPGRFEEQASILDLAQVKGYLKQAEDYPLPLSPALPVFSWARQFTPGKNLLRLIEGGALAQLDGSKFEPAGNNRLIAKQDHFLAGRQVAAGDILVIEHPDPSDLRQLAKMVRRVLRPERVLLFDYGHESLTRLLQLDPEVMHAISAAF